MQHIPAISAILSPKHIAEYVVNIYGFDKTTTCTILKIGINHTYLIITPTKKFVFRVYFLNWRTETEIEEELKLLYSLQEKGVAVSYPIKDNNHKEIQKIVAAEGERFAVLFSFAEGEAIRKPSEENCYQLGRAIAKMHQQNLNKKIARITYNSDTLVNWAFIKTVAFFPEPSLEMKFFKEANDRVKLEFKNADESQLRKGIVHLDLWYENMKLKGDSFTFFDFDNCGNGWLFLDIAYSLMLIFRNEPNKENYRKKQAEFFKGYEEITLISEEEKRLIPFGGLAIWLHFTGIHVVRFNDFSNQFFSKEFLKYWIQTVNVWMRFHHIEIISKPDVNE